MGAGLLDSKKSEAIDGFHVRTKIIAQNEGDLVRWRFVSVEVNPYGRHDVCAGTSALKVFRMLIAKAASHCHTEHGHRKIIAILDVAVAFFHAEMEDQIFAHPPREAKPDRIVVWLLIKAHDVSLTAARVWQEFFTQSSCHESWLGRSAGGAKSVSQSWEFGR